MREASHFYATMRRWPRFDIHIIPELVLNDRRKLRESLKRILHSHIRDIVIFCDQRDLAHIMNEVHKLNVFGVLIAISVFRGNFRGNFVVYPMTVLLVSIGAS